MKQPIVSGVLVALGLSLISSVSLASAVEDRFREEGKAMDLTGFLQSESDARSQSFQYDRVYEHAFSVDTAGDYRFESDVPGGQSEDYRLEATLLDSDGGVIARADALGQNGGLDMRKRLEPGDYVLRVEGQKYGSKGSQGNSYYVTVVGIDDQGNRTNVLDDGGTVTTSVDRDGNRSAFVNDDDAVTALAAPAATAASQAGRPSQPEAPEASATPEDPSQPAAPAASAQAQSFQTIVTDVKIRARGEVLSFEVQNAGAVAITTSTYPTGYEGTYRIELEVRDQAGNVVARDAGEGFDGDVDLETRLEPGQYRIWVNGQKFGSAMTGVNNYELRVKQLD
jgi:hypothetical protein